MTYILFQLFGTRMGKLQRLEKKKVIPCLSFSPFPPFTMVGLAGWNMMFKRKYQNPPQTHHYHHNYQMRVAQGCKSVKAAINARSQVRDRGEFSGERCLKFGPKCPFYAKNLGSALRAHKI